MKKVSLILSLVFLITLSFDFAAQAQKKWSPQAKGAVIGTGTGAAAGAIIHKRNRVVGGIVGGVAGGAAGYAIGKHIDKKQKQKEAERIAAINRAEARRAASERAAARKAEPQTRTVANNNAANTPDNHMGQTGYPAVNAYSYNASQSPIMNLALLPNEHYGDASKPYYTSEYRRKSW